MQKLNEWLQLIANLGVVISIGFLAYEISQNTNMMQAQIYSDRASVSGDFWTALADSEHLATIWREIRTSKNNLEAIRQLSDEDLERYRLAHLALLRQFDNIQIQYEMGLISESYYQSQQLRGLRYFAPMWREMFKGNYGSPEFNAAIEQVLAELDAANLVNTQ